MQRQHPISQLEPQCAHPMTIRVTHERVTGQEGAVWDMAEHVWRLWTQGQDTAAGILSLLSSMSMD